MLPQKSERRPLGPIIWTVVAGASFGWFVARAVTEHGIWHALFGATAGAWLAIFCLCPIAYVRDEA